MKISLLLSSKRLLLLLVGVLSGYFSLGAIYTVDRPGGGLADGAGNVGSFAYVLDQIRGTMGPHTVNFTETGVITNAGGPSATLIAGDCLLPDWSNSDPNAWKAPWTLAVNQTGATAANLVTINGNGVTLDWSDYPGTNGVDYGVNVLTIAGSFIEVNDVNFINGAVGTETSPDGCYNYAAGAGVLIADPDGYGLTNQFENITLNNCNFTNNGGAGVFNSTYARSWQAGGAATGTTVGVNNIFLNDCNSTNNGLSGAQFANADVVEIRGGNYSNNGNHGIFFTGAISKNDVDIPATDLTNAVGVSNGIITDGVSQLIASSNGNGGIVIEGNSTDNTINSATTNSNQEHGLWLRLGSKRNTIQNSTSNSNGGGTLSCGINMSLGGNDDNIIENNSCDGNQNFGIYLYDNYGIPNNNNIIRDNTISSNGSHGIYILNSTLTFVRGNSIHSNGTDVAQSGDGINFGNSSSGGEISDNEVYDNRENGINITEGQIIPADPGDANTVLIPAGGSNNNDVFDNYVGILKNGTVQANELNGIKILKSSGNEVGVNGRNFVSGNLNHGIYLDEIPVGTQSIIRDNYIGTNLTGTAANGNTLSGIFLSNCKQVLIDDNLISGNQQDGIQLGNAATNISTDVVEIENNLIGTDVNGTSGLPNSRYGINVDNATFVEIGDGTAAGRNIVSANGSDGINVSNDAADVTIDDNYIGLDITGNAILANVADGIDMTGAHNNTINNNYVSGNGENGIIIQGSSGATNPNVVTANKVGLMVNGNDAGNSVDGISLTSNSDQNIIGGTTAAEGNVIGFNDGDGISILVQSTRNRILNNYIGIDASDNNIANDGDGIQIDGTSNGNFVGEPTNGNNISNNGINGIRVMGGSTASVNQIQANIIGLTSADADAANGANGILLEVAATNNTIGGDITLGEGNVIAGSHAYQVYLDASADGNNIYGNFIGTPDGGTVTSAVIQATNNAIYVVDASNNNIGGAGNNGNVIAHDVAGNSAILIEGTSDNNDVSGNMIGMQLGGTATLGALVTAVEITGTATSNSVGANGANTIGQSSSDAIYVHGTGVSLTTVTGNFIGLQSDGTTPSTGIALNGIHVDGATSTTIDGNFISQVLGGDGILMENSNSGSSVINANEIGTASSIVGNAIRAINSTFGGLDITANVLQDATEQGVYLSNVDNVVASSNHIGTDATGAAVSGNAKNGVLITDAEGAVNTVTISNNNINANGENGVEVIGTSGGADLHLTVSVSGNFIGIANTPVGANGNTLNGVNIIDADGAADNYVVTNNLIGGNVIGVNVNNSSGVNIDGNHIGLSAADPAVDLGNTSDGVYLSNGATGNTIGGNAIGFNDDNGIELDAATSNTITGNHIGINNKGTLDGNIANATNGIALLNGSNSNTINGANRIGNHATGSGILLDASSSNTLAANIIGTEAVGSTIDLANQYGVKIQNGSSSNVINGGNTVAFSTTMGIDISGATSLTNTITANSLYCNAAGNTVTTATTTTGLGTGIQLAGDGANNNVGKTISVAYTDANGDPQTATTFSEFPATQDGALNTLTMENLAFAAGWTVDVYSNDINCQNCQGYAMEAGLSGSVLDGSGDLTLTDASIDGSKTYVLILTDPTGNSTEHSACSIAPTCAYPWANYIANTPEFSLTATANPEDKASFCEGGSHEFEINPTQDVTNVDSHQYRWYAVDSTLYDFTAHDTTLTGVPTNAAFTEVQAAGTTLTYDASSTGYYFFYINVDGDQACGVMSEIVKVQEHIDPVPTIVGADKVCEGTVGESYESLSTNPFLQHALDFNLTTVATYTVTGATLATPATGVTGNDYTGAAASYGTQTLDFTTTDATLSLVESYDIKSSSLLAATDLTCDNATAVTFDIELQENPEVTNPALTESICDATSSTGVTLTSDVTGATFKWSSVATNLTGNTAGPSTGNLPAETLTLTDGDLVGTTVYTVYASIDITPTGGAVRTCEDATLTEDFTVTVEPLPTVPNGLDVEVCADDNATLVAYDPANPATVVPDDYAWSGPASFTGTGSSVTLNNVTAAMAGTYTIEVSKDYPAITGGVCEATGTLDLIVNALPEPEIEVEPDPCPNGNVVYNLTAASAPSGTPVYAWSTDVAGVTENNGQTNATYDLTFGSTGTGDVMVTVTDDNTCVGNAALAITVLSNPSVVINTSTVCDDQNQVFTSTPNPSTATYTYQWFQGTPGSGFGITGETAASYSVASGVHTDGQNIYVEIVPVSCPTSTAVPSNAEQVEFNTTPTNVTISGLDVVCEGDPVTLTGTYTGTLEGAPIFAWIAPDGTTSSANPAFTHNPAVAGTYLLTVTNSSGGCNAQGSKNVSTIIVDVDAFASDTDIDEGTSVTISAAPTTYSSYDWVTDKGDDKGSNVAFADAPAETTTYTVTATEGTCTASADVTVNVRALVVVPSMFTPSNGDGLNDYWILTNIEDYPEAEIKVYNRWGNVVYKGPGGPEYLGNPWDGRKNGTDLPSAVYYYVIELNYRDIVLNGSVTIMR